jgi:hypothetical protein
METAMDRKYFPHFKQEMVDVGDGVSINALAGGQGKEALLLLHGHPETHLIWRFMAEQLAEKYFVVLADMRGYGDSSKPVGLPDHSNYSKRVMAQDMIRVMNPFRVSEIPRGGARPRRPGAAPAGAGRAGNGVVLHIDGHPSHVRHVRRYQ